MPLLLEHWKPVVGWEDNTEVSCVGTVRRIDTFRRMNCGLTHDGYLRVSLRGQPNNVHLIVGKAFHSPRPPGMLLDHIDANKQNPRASNLEWVTPHENCLRAAAKGL
jgi:hypothetical protein